MSTDEDVINPLYCSRCHKATPRADLNLYKGMCYTCKIEVDRLRAQSQQATQQQAQAVPQPSTASPQQQPVINQMYGIPGRPKGSRTWIIVFAFLLPIVSAVAGLFFLIKESAEDRDTGRFALLWSAIGILCISFACAVISAILSMVLPMMVLGGLHNALNGAGHP